MADDITRNPRLRYPFIDKHTFYNDHPELPTTSLCITVMDYGHHKMPKRHHDDLSDSPPPKRLRVAEEARQVDRLSSLSDEILLHILSFLPIPALLTCQRSERLPAVPSWKSNSPCALVCLAGSMLLP